MDHASEEWIRRRAYALWEADGCPTGRDADHWHQATMERQALEKTQASSDGREILATLWRIRFASNINSPPHAEPHRHRARSS